MFVVHKTSIQLNFCKQNIIVKYICINLLLCMYSAPIKPNFFCPLNILFSPIIKIVVTRRPLPL